MGLSPEKAESVATGTALEGIVVSAVVQAWWFGTSWFCHHWCTAAVEQS